MRKKKNAEIKMFRFAQRHRCRVAAVVDAPRARRRIAPRARASAALPGIFFAPGC
jgi:hypothetical protein